MKIERIYILARDEAPNIERTLDRLAVLDTPVTVLDSGSTDGTGELAEAQGASVRRWEYFTHARAYNTLALEHRADDWIAILDADTYPVPALASELQALGPENGVTAYLAPVILYWCGKPLRHAGMYPPKPFLFKGGQELFAELGHGEALRPQIRSRQLSHALVHDDRKPYESELAKQIRYGRKIVAAHHAGRASRVDRLRVSSPIMSLAAPAIALLAKRGFLDGRAGLVYALDRAIAELIFYRESVAARIEPDDQISDDSFR